MSSRPAAAVIALASLYAGTAPAANEATTAARFERLAASFRDGPLTVGEAAATTIMVLAIALVAFSAGGWGRDRRAPVDRTAPAWIAVGAAVLAWSVFVRFGLTEANILTDGGSGYTRVMRYVEGYGGLAILVKLLPAEWAAFMAHAMVVPRLLAALAPALLVWVGRELGLGLGAALLAGIMLASLPAHAVLTSSDHIEGAMASLQLAGLAFVLAARRSERSDLFAAGLALAAWAMWCRPEAALGLLPIAAAALRFPIRWWRRPTAVGASVVLVALVLVRVYAMATSDTAASLGTGGRPPLSSIAWGSLLWSTIIVPVWVWAPAPFALGALWRRRALGVVLAGLAAGVVPVYLRGLLPEPVGTHLEIVRYGIPALGWLSLMSAVALDSAAGWIVARLHLGSPWLLRAAVLLGLLLVPVVHREYLGRQYGHVAAEPVIRALLRQVPPRCGVAVPDDIPENVHIEISEQYRYIAAEAAALGEIPQLTVVPASELLDGKVDATACWTYLRGPYCYHGFDGRPGLTCQGIENHFVLQEIASQPIEFRHHRLVTGPDLRRAPWYMPAMPITLYRITGVKARIE